MSESEIIQAEYEAIKRYCHGDRKLALSIIGKLGATMRSYIQGCAPNKVTPDELYSLIQTSANSGK